VVTPTSTPPTSVIALSGPAAVFSRLDRHDFAVIYESSIRGHAAVIEAIRNRDPIAASAAMAAHIEEARDEVMAVLSDEGNELLGTDTASAS
jgi:DNA-binding GntR family transcriptional regulator